VQGAFARGEVIACLNGAGVEVARGLTNYSSAETKLIQRHPSGEIEGILGYMLEPELIHRDNLVLV
jgi:glutamate 5-kinase